ncbi:EAL domain-containing protein [Sphingomonas gilva]|uniref:EAL domain-containing protein n=1 Tax=Sphingomonas gilva TaxID=2305907 RepID=A0A396RJB8_9SPHN|nr:EAL domain-containing protein [Sphingomonas gilva]RHW16247.1 EAL domain-containing protein [Sphingomonas gilva]
MLFAFGKKLLQRRRAAIVLGALLIGAITLQTRIGQSIDRAMADARAVLRDQPPSGKLVLVEIDRRSLRTYGNWPWPRRYHGALVDRLSEAGAERIAFDIDFSSRSNPVDDRAFAAALARSGGRVILASGRERMGASPDVDIMPIPELATHATIAAIPTAFDPDGFVRHGSTGEIVRGRPRPSTSVLLAEAPVAPGRLYRLDMSIDVSKITRLSAADVIAGEFDPALVAGKRVVIGATALEMGDRVLFPRKFPDRSGMEGMTPSHVLPGVFVHLIGAETLLAGKTPVFMGGVLPMIFALGAVFATAFVRSRVVAGVAIVATALVLLIGPLIAESTLRWVFLVVPALMMLFAGVAMRGLASLAQSFFDSVATNELSGLPNAHALHFDVRSGERVHIAVARIQDLSAITAVLGEKQAGELLRRVAERIAFIAENAKVYHPSDAVFAWMIPPGSEDEAPDRFEALTAILSAPIRIGPRPIDIALTYGLCTGEADLQVALRGATLAAERAAERGLRWHSYSSDEQDEASWRMSLLGELDGAIDSGQVWVAYQPKYDLKSGMVIGAEALVRWLHPERGAIRPDNFVPLAEESGRIGKLTRHVLDTALGDFATITSAVQRPVVAVNLSTTMLSAPNLVEMVCDALWRNGVLPEQLVLEVTESAAMTSDENALAVLERFRSMGIGISIDDYGTGQSTLNYLKRLPATELKIDQSFVRAIADSRSDEILVNSTIQLGHQLGMKVVAEGVETTDVLERLEAFGCDVVQGYLIGKPVPFNIFTRNYRPQITERAA